MKIYKTAKSGIVVEKNNRFYALANQNWDSFINRDNLHQQVLTDLKGVKAIKWAKEDILKPIQGQEIWAAGVTYLKSRDARMEEAKDSGGGDFYAKVYDAVRPEIFFKSTARRSVGDGEEVYIRHDSVWNVPEPELTLFATSSGQIVAYTIGNDMSSRDIEGENPLYLPQAKSYDKSAAIGPCLYVPAQPIDPNTTIALEIERQSVSVFNGTISINQMKRTHTELISYLFKEMSFEDGVFLMTGTCLVPPNDFTLQMGDIVRITISNIGTLTNIVTKK
jgi:2-dehydro-3-deoxy-D-arabinonate dehydratase